LGFSLLIEHSTILHASNLRYMILLSIKRMDNELR